MGFKWSTSPMVFSSNWKAYVPVARRAMMDQIIGMVPEMADWMQNNAPWQDVSGEARQSLNIYVTSQGFNIVVTFSHGVFYGEYLENNNGNEFAIIVPTINYWGPIIMGSL